MLRCAAAFRQPVAFSAPQSTAERPKAPPQSARAPGRTTVNNLIPQKDLEMPPDRCLRVAFPPTPVWPSSATLPDTYGVGGRVGVGVAPMWRSTRVLDSYSYSYL